MDKDECERFCFEQNLLPTKESVGSPVEEKRHENRKIMEMKKPSNQDDSFLIIQVCVIEYETKHGYTPTELELWATLRKNPPKDYEVTFAENSITLEGQQIDREAFGKRYKRYYPSSHKK